MSIFTQLKRIAGVAILAMPLVGLTSAVAQEAAVLEAGFESSSVSCFSYSFAGYGINGEVGTENLAELISVTNEVADAGGNPGHCATATLDSSNLKIPVDATYDYVGWGVGTNFDLATPWTETDLSQYSVMFDAKISGTKELDSSKMQVQFSVPDDTFGTDDDVFDDVVVRLVRGGDGAGGLLSFTKEYQTFTFNLKDDLAVQEGELVKLKEHPAVRMSISIQAQGNASDLGADADNVLFVDNVRLIKK